MYGMNLMLTLSLVLSNPDRLHRLENFLSTQEFGV